VWGHNARNIAFDVQENTICIKSVNPRITPHDQPSPSRCDRSAATMFTNASSEKRAMGPCIGDPMRGHLMPECHPAGETIRISIFGNIGRIWSARLLLREMPTNPAPD
jgi:hypothetical protein